jgi:KDO2-lipid IV(A) lauroyltransferase
VFSDAVYVIIFYIIGYRKKVVKANLRLVFPQKSEREINTITKKFYHHLCDMMLESVKSLTISEASMKKRFAFTNIEELTQFEKQNKSVIIIGGHYANFEWMFVLQRFLNARLYVVYKKLANKYFDRLIQRKRGRYNNRLITTKETVPEMIKAKRKGELTVNGFASDQSPHADKAHHWNDFMGVKVPIHVGAEVLAKKLDMAVVYINIEKVKRGFYETTFKTIAENPKAFKNYDITDAYLKLLEQQIHEAPEYYLWTHKRWKHKDKVPANFQ